MRAVWTVALATGLVGAAPPPAMQQQKPPLPADIISAWEKAGARAGWLGPNEFGNLQFRAGAGEATEADVPAFQFTVWRAGVVGRLPQPEGGFGFSFYQMTLTDPGLKELSGLKSLQALNLGYTLITDAGLKELSDLKSLQYLRLEETQVTDAGLKDLAGMKSLDRLDLSKTQVMSAGVAELRKALPGASIVH